jgi:hypothetical protein
MFSPVKEYFYYLYHTSDNNHVRWQWVLIVNLNFKILGSKTAERCLLAHLRLRASPISPAEPARKNFVQQQSPRIANLHTSLLNNFLQWNLMNNWLLIYNTRCLNFCSVNILNIKHGPLIANLHTSRLQSLVTVYVITDLWNFWKIVKKK